MFENCKYLMSTVTGKPQRPQLGTKGNTGACQWVANSHRLKLEKQRANEVPDICLSVCLITTLLGMPHVPIRVWPHTGLKGTLGERTRAEKLSGTGCCRPQCQSHTKLPQEHQLLNLLFQLLINRSTDTVTFQIPVPYWLKTRSGVLSRLWGQMKTFHHRTEKKQTVT